MASPPRSLQVDARAIWRRLVTQTTAHGIPRLSSAGGPVKRWFWGVLTCAMTCVLLSSLIQATRQYFEYRVSLSVTIFHENEVVFPAVTLCNMSPIKKAALNKPDVAELLGAELRQLLDMQQGGERRRRRRRRTVADVKARAHRTSSGGTMTVRRRDKRSADLCDSGWLEKPGRCYFMSTTVATASQAYSFCLGQGGNMVDIQNQDENDLVQSISVDVTGSRYWIGLTLPTAAVIWVWTVDIPTVPTWANWMSGFPSGIEEKCSFMSSAEPGLWKTASCSGDTRKYICAKPFNVITTTLQDQVTTTSSTEKNTVVPNTEHTTISASTEKTTIVASTEQTTNVASTEQTKSVASTEQTKSVASTEQTTSVASTEQTKSVASTEPTTSVPSIEQTTISASTEPSTVLPMTEQATMVTITEQYTISPSIKLATTLPSAMPIKTKISTKSNTDLFDRTVEMSSLIKSDAVTPNYLDGVVPNTSLFGTCKCHCCFYDTPLDACIEENIDNVMTWELDDEQPQQNSQYSNQSCDSVESAFENESSANIAVTRESSDSWSVSSVTSAKPHTEPSATDTRPRDAFTSAERLTELLSELPDHVKAMIGFQADDLIVDCMYMGYTCLVKDFAHFYNPLLGNCYIFNSAWPNVTGQLWKSHKAGRRHGLRLILNVDQNNYVKHSGDTAGVRMVVHPQGYMAFPEDDGISVSPGHATSVSLRRVKIKRADKPHGNCTSNTEHHEELNLYEEHFPVSYTSQGCRRTCYQREVLNKCGCVDPYYPLTGSALSHYMSPPICSILNKTQDQCKEDVSQNFSTMHLNCDCPEPCDVTTFSIEVSHGTWPSNVQRGIIVNSLRHKLQNTFDVNSHQEFTDNMMKIEVYYEEFNSENISEDPAYSPGNFLSDVGGILGLWLGCSIMSVTEFLEVFIDIAFILVMKIASRRNNVSKKQLTVEHGDDLNTGARDIPETIEMSPKCDLAPLTRTRHVHHHDILNALSPLPPVVH